MNITFKIKVEYPVLTKVVGELDYVSLKIIRDELKANTASIHSNLGGGTEGHLGLVIHPIEYSFVSATTYAQHILPIPPVIAPCAMQHEATHLYED